MNIENGGVKSVLILCASHSQTSVLAPSTSLATPLKPTLPFSAIAPGAAESQTVLLSSYLAIGITVYLHDSRAGYVGLECQIPSEICNIRLYKRP